MTAINTTEVCPAGISIWRWLSLSSRTARVSATSRRAWDRWAANFTTWDSVVGLLARPWRTPMKLTTGASSPISHLVGIARPLHVEDPMGVDLDNSLYALDSTTIDLCLSLFPWAKFRQHKGAVKMHTLLDLHGNIPTFIRITDGKVHDVNILDEIVP